MSRNSEQVKKVISSANLRKKWVTNLTQYARDVFAMTGIRTNAYEKLEVSANLWQ